MARLPRSCDVSVGTSQYRDIPAPTLNGWTWVPMDRNYDILKRHPDGMFIWIETKGDLQAARERLKQLAARSPGGTMRTQFDILKKDRKGTFQWLEAVSDIETAKSRLLQLSTESPEEFVAFRGIDLQVVATSKDSSVVDVN